MVSSPRSKGGHWTEGEALSSLLARAAEPGWILVDGERTIRAVSSAAARLLKMPREELVQQPVGRLPGALVLLFEQTLTGQDQGREPLVVAGQGTDQRQVVQASSFRWQSVPGESPVVLLVLHDLEAARELEAHMDRLHQLSTVGTLSASVAHEVKNALVLIKTSTDLIHEQHPNLDAAALVQREIGRIDSLVTQLLRYAGPARPSFGTVHVHAVLRDALRLVQDTLRTRRIQEVILLDASGDRVNGDARHLEQAFLNLLLNAADAMPQGGRLVVRSEIVLATEHISKFEPNRREPQIQIDIRDSGPGIAPEVMERLYQPFCTTKEQGTGLGLTITQRIITEHHGVIRAECKAGEGTLFRILLPLLRTEG